MKYQGKSKKQYEDSARFVGYSIIGMIALLVVMTLFSSCATTKVDKCCEKTVSDENMRRVMSSILNKICKFAVYCAEIAHS